ncbi:hypothetical protein OG444_30810 [Streptomyces sp. NBC_01232]|uniref:hypothetical protein n=1 Tax=Streptomyces sp. NBC_01232 TaxID=2903786 RepID=UPI002E0FA3F6|nr:hypothetical protein OG444_30810 [Streptomyces sp. NBC_01232]
MDLEGIGAISAAAVAALGVSAAVIVGRWQMRGALRAAEETGRAGVAQAQSTYRAALDAVHTEADAAHLQWRRSIRRDAYAGFLLAMTRCVQAAEALPRGRLADTSEDLSAAEGELARAKNDLNSALWVVKLEGPPAVANGAEGVSSLTFELADALVRKAEFNRAASSLHHLGSSNPVAAELDAALMGLAVTVDETGYNAQLGSGETPPREVTDGVERVNTLYGQLSDDIDTAGWVALLNEALNYRTNPQELQIQLSSTVEQLLPVCRQALDDQSRSGHDSPPSE